MSEYIRIASRTDFSKSRVSSGHMLLFAENQSLIGKLSDSSFISIGGELASSYLDFSSVDASNNFTFNSSVIPVSLLAPSGHLYPIEKGSITVDKANNTITLNVDPYLVYQDIQSFSGTWRIFFAAGKSVFAVDSINGKTGDVLLDAQDVGAMQSPSDSGSQGQVLTRTQQGYSWQDLPSPQQQIVTYTGTSIVPKQDLVIKHTLQASDSITISTSQLTSDRQVTFQLHLIQPSTAVAFTLPSNVIWGEGNYFGSSNQPPDMTEASTEYVLIFRWDGEQLLGNLAYTKEISV